ncbi:MAG: RlmE family RNA methyltransferase [Hyphomonadaceae bacterium]
MNDDGKRRWKKPKNPAGNTSGRRVNARKVTAHNAQSESSKKWIERQLSDPYVQKARDAGYRARAAFKLLEIHERTGLLKAGQRVVDLGCAPGGWLQILQLRGLSEIVGIDLLPVDPLADVHIIEGDVNDPEAVAQMLEGLSGPPNLVLSDMAANTTGHRQTDHLRTVALVEIAVEFALTHLEPGGAFCSKVFQGGATSGVLHTLKQNFKTVKHIKPPSSRAGSPEIFVVATGFAPLARGSAT